MKRILLSALLTIVAGQTSNAEVCQNLRENQVLFYYYHSMATNEVESTSRLASTDTHGLEEGKVMMDLNICLGLGNLEQKTARFIESADKFGRCKEVIITDKKFLDLGGMVIKAQMFCSPNVKNESRYRDNKALLETLNDLSISMDEIHNELHQQK